MQWSGTMTALVTPFTAKGGVDYETLERSVAWQIKNGVSGLVPCGTTGESPTLNEEETLGVIRCVVKAARGRVPVIAGAGSNCTSDAVDMSKKAEKAGADAVLQVNPYYNRPNQEGLYKHFKKIADSIGIAVVLYNIPGRTGVQMANETIARLGETKNIVAVKEATGNLDNVSHLRNLSDIVILSGDDSATLPMMALGARGVISVASNLVPAQVSKMAALALQGNFAEARILHQKLFPFFKYLLAADSNPIPLKRAMQLAGRGNGALRLPLTPLADGKVPELKKILSTLKVV